MYQISKETGLMNLHNINRKEANSIVKLYTIIFIRLTNMYCHLFHQEPCVKFYSGT